MKCSGCGYESALRIQVRYNSELKKSYEHCEKCAGIGMVGIPDVSVPAGGYYDEHLGCQINSKRQKAELLKQKGWVECGDRKNEQLGKPMPYIKDPIKRRNFMRENFGR